MPGNVIVLDASVVVKWFHEEPDTDRAETLLQQIVSGEVQAIVPPLLFYEVANVLTLKAGSQVDEILAAHRMLHRLPFKVVEVLDIVMEDAIRIAHQYHISVYDASYVALAISYNATLITADEKLVEMVGTQYIEMF